MVNDADYKVWQAYGVEAWPTLILVSPDGKIAFRHEGENVYDVLNPQIQKLVTEYAGKVNTNPFAFKQVDMQMPPSLVKFPSKLVAGKNGVIWLSDYGNNRVVEIDRTGKIIETIGSGTQGFKDGNFSEAAFSGPQGLAMKDNLLFIADSRNNSIRQADLNTRQVKTIAGNGKMGYYFDSDKWNAPVLPNTPWDLLLDNDYLYIADAGNHQVLRMKLANDKVYRFAGSGREGIEDADLQTSTFSQPSGLTKKGDIIYVADPEASAIREIDLRKRSVNTVIGKGLFKFGDQDGNVQDVLLQHCTGITRQGDNIYIADTYNGKIKAFNTRTNEVTSLTGGLDEPNDVLAIGNELWITDTNHNRLIKYDLTTNSKETVDVHN